MLCAVVVWIALHVGVLGEISAMRVCLINLPQPNSLDDRLDTPLGLLYVAAVLRDDGHEVSVVDLSGVERASWSTHIPVADVYGLTVFTCAYNIAKAVRDIAKVKNPDAPVMVGGAHPTALSIETARDFDIVIQGEGEWVARDALRSKARGVLPRAPVVDLDVLPLPAREFVDLQSYHRKVGEALATSLITSRGCPFHCSFCGSDTMFGRVRYRAIDKVIEELASLQAQGFQSFLFYDDTFVLYRKRLYSLLAEIKRLHIQFRCNGRAGYNTLEDFERLKDAGCHTVAFGIESGSQTILDRANKRVTVKANEEAIANAKRAGLVAKAFLIVGLPGETQETIDETKRFIDRTDPDAYTLFTFIPFPGCDVWARPAFYGVRIDVSSWDDYYVIAGQNDGGSVVTTDTYDAIKLAAFRQDLLTHLRERTWRGTVEGYESRVTWRR